MSLISRRRLFAWIGFAAIPAVVAAVIVYLLFAGRGAPARDAVTAVQPRFEAEDRRDGLHCLEPDGSHAGVIERVKARLPHPETFRNTGTAIYPLREGKHFLVMGFRSLAENGHRTNAGIALTKVDHLDCYAGEIDILD